jgi:hypothetical protein
MVMAARRGAVRERHLTPLAGGGAAPEGPLADRLAAAQAAVAEPQRRVAELEAALADAVERSDYATAAEVQAQLPAAREALGLAEVDVRVVAETQVALAATADAERQEITEAQRRDQARQTIEASGAVEQRTQSEIDAALGEMRRFLVAARTAYRRALAEQDSILLVRRVAAQARFDLGEIGEPPNPFGEKHPRPLGPPVVMGENRVSVLADTDPLIGALVKWCP